MTLELDRPAFKSIFRKFVFLYEYQATDEFYNQYSVQSYLELYENKTRCLKNNSSASWPKNTPASNEIVP